MSPTISTVSKPKVPGSFRCHVEIRHLVIPSEGIRNGQIKRLTFPLESRRGMCTGQVQGPGYLSREGKVVSWLHQQVVTILLSAGIMLLTLTEDSQPLAATYISSNYHNPTCEYDCCGFFNVFHASGDLTFFVQSAKLTPSKVGQQYLIPHLISAVTLDPFQRLSSTNTVTRLCSA